ncbi:MAG: hypothetical protein H9Q66_04080, partial [Spiroplasma ixodetis]|nr:hypothetical protein [Spiroplasma ixodetis]
MLYSKKSENLITEKEKTTTNSRKIKPQLPITTSLAEILLNNNEKLVGTITSDQYLNKDNKQVPLYKLIKSSEPNKKINIKAINSIKNDKQPTTILNKRTYFKCGYNLIWGFLEICVSLFYKVLVKINSIFKFYHKMSNCC